MKKNIQIDQTTDQANLLIQCGELLAASWLFPLHVIYIHRQLVPHQLVLPVSASVLCTYGINEFIHKIKDNKNVHFFCCI